MSDIASPDGYQMMRQSCPCGYTVAVVIWCRDPRCCDQDPARFTRSLVSAQTARGIPVFAVRSADPAAAGSAGDQVTVWRPGEPTPAFTGPADAAIRIQMRHECRRT